MLGVQIANQLQSELQAFDQLEESQNLPKETFDKRAELKSNLLLILEEEEILWNTRAKQRWLKEGDGNTKFFHAFANGRKRSNTIVAIEDDFGQQITNEELKRSYFYQSFKRIFASKLEERGIEVVVSLVEL
ncbi:hypothetical protein ACMD2_16525 [Ananas comosus]|uniref:Uncharacterized protein n=1 Tax=Ananas comosus TaxID=4615 RepID=A0A199UTI1_ANACO|nr:hypothetical protein ACMD2_16525 [Ananas comosus]